jgi:type IV pilus assembly protein PilY1
MENRRGWFMDLVTPSGQPEGERVVSGSAVYNFARPTLIVASIIPEQSECSSRGRGYLNAIDPFNGGAMPLTIFDVNRDRSFNDADGLNGRVVGSIALGSGMGTEAVAIGTTLVQGDSTGGRGKVDVNPGGPSRVGRISWREIVR